VQSQGRPLLAQRAGIIRQDIAMNRLILLLASYFLMVSLVHADFPKPASSQSTSPFPPVVLTSYVYDQPRPLRAWTIRIDLTHPDIEFIVTPQVPVDAGWVTRCMTTLDFARQEKVQLAINASPFEPLREKAGEPMKIVGLHLTRGQTLSPPLTKKDDMGALLLHGDNQARLFNYPLKSEELALARHGLGGFSMVLQNGKNLLNKERTELPAKHPRTAVGLSEQGKYLWWLIVDGRQPGKSEGLTYKELGDWALTLGIPDVLNFDGGGSTTLVLQDPKSSEYQVINTPVGTGPPGSLRQNGNNLGLRLYTEPNDLTLKQLLAIMPHLPVQKAKLFLGPLNRAMAQHEINTPRRRAAFLAQLAHESGELRYMEELASGEAYEGRASLGNIQPGDGKRYKGRGPIQLTGRFNYRKAGEALGIDLEDHPEKATDPETGCRIAGWFWNTRRLNPLADSGDFKQITKIINGGYHGQVQREHYYQKAKEVFGLK
jgi:predicted chitinase